MFSETKMKHVKYVGYTLSNTEIETWAVLENHSINKSMNQWNLIFMSPISRKRIVEVYIILWPDVPRMRAHLRSAEKYCSKSGFWRQVLLRIVTTYRQQR